MSKLAATVEGHEFAFGEGEAEEIEEDQYLVFTARGQEFGIQAMRVKEISAMIEITKVPKAPSYIEGILNLRGRLVSIINFRKKFGFDAKKLDEDTRIVIVEHRGFPIGIMVDTVEEVIRIPDENVQKLPETAVTSSSQEYLTGVGMLSNRLIVLLDADQLLSKAEVLESEGIRNAASGTQVIEAVEPLGQIVESPEASDEQSVTPEKEEQ
jgi:purine-binding chemotaxis protein CheW